MTADVFGLRHREPVLRLPIGLGIAASEKAKVAQFQHLRGLLFLAGHGGSNPEPTVYDFGLFLLSSG